MMGFLVGVEMGLILGIFLGRRTGFHDLAIFLILMCS